MSNYRVNYILDIMVQTIRYKRMYFLALEMASPRNQHCANRIGTLSFPIQLNYRKGLKWTSRGALSFRHHRSDNAY